MKNLVSKHKIFSCLALVAQSSAASGATDK